MSGAPEADAGSLPPLPLPVATDATLEALEFPAFRAVVAQFATTDLGRSQVLALEPLGNEERLHSRRRAYEEVERLVEDRPLVPPFDEALAGLLHRLDTGHPPLSGPEVVRLGALLGATHEAAGRILQAKPPCPELAARAGRLPDGEPLRRLIRRTLDRRGEVREDASPRLAALRRQIRQVRDRLYQDLHEFVARHREDLSEETIPMRGGRLVLVLQSGARGRLQGLIHGRSATGKSFYFEPYPVVETNNQLQQAVEDEEAERQRVLLELLGKLREGLPTLADHAAFLGELDLLQAAARFARAVGARLCDLGPRHELRLVAARHPLLDPGLAEVREAALGQAGHRERIVPLDVEFSPTARALVVTGPNAGGKTVALKTLGLLTAAALCGLPIPAAAGTTLPFLRRLTASVGDEQDLLQDRSTFSGRLLRLKEAWELAGPDTLVLLDELGSGTDPEEGAALAIALLEGLLEKGALVFITTHLTQLAAAALEAERAACAAMEFDPDTGQPTFRLVPGAPGGSQALALARRLGLAPELLERAENRLGREHRDLRRLLAELESLRLELARERERLETEARHLQELQDRLEEEKEALEKERTRLAKRLKAELETFRRETAARLADEVDRLRQEFQSGRRRGLVTEAVDRLFAQAPRLEEAEEETPGPLEEGQEVRHRTLGWTGTLERLHRDRAEVRVRGKRITCKAEDLMAVAGPTPKGSGSRGGGKVAVKAEDPGDLSRELNLVGRRVEPALEALDAYLDQALLAGHREVRIIHGHGSGRLRQAVREHLRLHPAVASQRPGAPNEGGNGATVVELKG